MSSSSGSSSSRFAAWKVGGKYNLEKLLGKGSYGEVAQGTDSRTGKKVAIKFMKDIFAQPTDAKRAYREMHILRHLQHANIIGLVDVLSPTLTENALSPADFAESLKRKKRLRDLGDLYLVFDFVDTDLSKIFKSDQHMLIGHVQFILYQLLLGLKHMHSANVIHRDIKPANILISCTDCSVKIADFGLARVIGEDAMVSRRDSVSGVQDSLFERPSDAGRPSDFLPMVPGERPDVTLPPVPGTDAVGPKASGEAPGLGPPMDVNPGGGLGPPMPLNDPANPQSTAPQRGSVPLRRQLTHHVVTRWYRAPEVILSQPYNASVDVWSVGCIFAELLGMIQENVRHYRQRRPLFPGESCGELSPDGYDTSFHDGTKEQLSIIFEVIGTPLDSQLTHLKPSTANELRGFRKREPENLRQRYPACDEVCLNLLTQLLAFDPASRLTVDDALRHPFLQAFHSEEKEATAVAGNPMSVEIETVGEDSNHLFDNIVREILHYKTTATG